MPDHLLSHSNSFGFEMEIDTAGCRAYNRNYIVGGGTNVLRFLAVLLHRLLQLILELGNRDRAAEARAKLIVRLQQ